MKKFKITFLLIFIGLFMYSFFTNCDFSKLNNPADDLDIRVKSIARETLVSVEIIDAKTGELVNNQVNIEFSGIDQGTVISTINEPMSNVIIDKGLLLFAIQDGIMPSNDNPIKLNILCSSNQHLPTSKPIKIYHDGMNTFSITLTNLNNTPQGVKTNIETKGSTGSSGTSQDIVVSSGEEAGSGAGASIQIKQGTKLKDANGNILTGQVQTRVTYFSPLEQQSLSAFPGGFVVELDDGREGVFVTAGFVAVDITVGGIEVEQFEGGEVKVQIDIPSGTINPITGVEVKAGDEVPVYSYDEDNGRWDFENNVTVPSGKSLAKGKNGHTVTIENLEHLSYWNLDWFGEGSCSEGVTLNFVATAGCYSNVKVEIVDAITELPVSWWSSNIIYKDDNEKTLYQVPGNTPVKVKVYDYVNYWTNGALLGEVTVPDLCATGSTIDVEFQATGIVFSLEVIIECDNSQLQLDGYPIWTQKYGEAWNYLGMLQAGELEACFENNKYYNFAIFFDGTWHYANEFIDDIVALAASRGITLQTNSSGFILMDQQNSSYTIILKDIDEICDR